MPLAGTETHSKRCTVCGDVRPHTDFHIRRASPDGLAPLCRDCAQGKARAYRERYRAQHPRAPLAQRRSKCCGTCRQDKPITAFCRNRSKPDGRIDVCRDCHSEKRRGNRTDDDRRRRTLRAFGLSLEDYRAMLEAQNGRCAICGSCEAGDQWNRGLHIDHCHETGRVRGLLCSPCNLMLGKAKDDPGRLRAAAEYLETRSER